MTDSDLKIILPDDEKILICPKCYTNNPDGSNFCLNCGFSLRKPSSGKNAWKWLFIAILMVVAGMFYFYERPSGPGPQQPVPQTPTAEVQAPVRKGARAQAPLEEPPPPKNEEISTPSSPLKFPMGTVVIKDITGKVINEVTVPVVGGGWIALPKQACLGGADWVLKMGPDTEVSIAGGIYSDYDRIGLWRILEDLTIDGPELYPWSANEQLTWLSMISDNAPEQVELESPREQGYFIEGLLQGDFTEAGILVQQGRAVGWTFGESAAGAFLWGGDEGRYLRPEIRVDDFYRITFANSREEEFTRALAMGADYSPLERLEAFAAGFKYERKLSAKETPAHLQTAAVTASMRELIAQGVKAGSARAVAAIFDAQILVEAADIGLLMDIGLATAQGYGFEDAAEALVNHHYQRLVQRGRIELAHVHLEKTSDAHELFDYGYQPEKSRWDKSVIVEDLVAEQGLERHTARMIAGMVEQKVFNLELNLVPASLVKQLVLSDTAAVMRAQRQLQTA